jgi:quercetin dioxygenase-like cupin family protein
MNDSPDQGNLSRSQLIVERNTPRDGEQNHKKQGEQYMNVELNPTTGVRLDVFGPTVEFLTSPQDQHNQPCVIRGVIPPGVFIPLHSHLDTEDFYIISGQAQALKQTPEGYEWIDGKAGDLIHVPGGVHHAWRNVGSLPLVALLITTTKMGRFFQEVGRPVTDTPQPVTPKDLIHFATVAAEYGYWNATPEENAAVGIHFSF